MQLKIQTDYAIRILMHLTKNKGYSSRKELCTCLGIAGTWLPVAPLLKTGWIASSYGPTGGYILVEDPKKITLLDVMEVMEDTIKMNRCLETDGFCSRHAAKNCPVNQIYEAFQDIYEDYFMSVTIEDLLTPVFLRDLVLMEKSRMGISTDPSAISNP